MVSRRNVLKVLAASPLVGLVPSDDNSYRTPTMIRAVGDNSYRTPTMIRAVGDNIFIIDTYAPGVSIEVDRQREILIVRTPRQCSRFTPFAPDFTIQHDPITRKPLYAVSVVPRSRPLKSRSM